MNNTINIAVVGLGQVGSYLFNELNIKKKDITDLIDAVLIDLEKEEIKDTYKIIVGEYQCAINNMSYALDYIFLSTSCGGFSANIDSPFLNDFNSWSWTASGEDITDLYYSETFDTALFAIGNSDPFSPNTIDIISGANLESYYSPEIVEITFINNKLHRIYSNKIIISNGLNLID